MTQETVEIDGVEVAVTKTEDGYEAVETVSESTAMERFAADHPAISYVEESSAFDYTLKVNFPRGLKPGTGNIGSGRTDAYKNHLEPKGIELDIYSIEPPFSGSNWNVFVNIE